jgi:hypothetical protein
MCPDVHCECSENCDGKLSEFLKRTYYVDAGHDNKEGMVRLNSRMAQIEVEFDLIAVSESSGKLEIEIPFIKFHHTPFLFHRTLVLQTEYSTLLFHKRHSLM